MAGAAQQAIQSGKLGGAPEAGRQVPAPHDTEPKPSHEPERERNEQEELNRQRQAERDQERNERLRAQEEAANGGDQPQHDSRQDDQPAVFVFFELADERELFNIGATGLVDREGRRDQLPLHRP